MLHLTAFYHIDYHDSTTVTATSDNAGLISRLTARTKYKVPYPNATLAPDWDVTEQIHLTLSEVGPDVTYEWIQGHQDRKIPYHRLPPTTQYNVRAHRLATGYMRMYGKPKLVSPLLPAARCTLKVGKVSYHGHYTQVIREEFSFPALLDHLQRRYHCKHPHVLQIDWPSLHLATQHSTIAKTRLTKIVYDMLPTRYRKSQAGATVPATCHHCTEPERFFHLLRCPYNPITKETAASLAEALQKHCRQHKAPSRVTNVLLRMVRDWFEGRPPLQQEETPPSVHRVISHQNDIGWDALMHGFFSNRWQHFFRCEYDRQATAPYRHEKFLPQLINILWNTWNAVWDQHLIHIHQSTDGASSPEKTNELQARIRSLHYHHHEVLAAHRSLYFFDDVEAFLLHASQSQLQNYIDNYEQPILQSMAQARLISATAPRIFELPGFVRLHPPRRGRTLLTRTTGAPIHHKHSRWKPTAANIQRFRNFFTSSPTTPPLP